MKRPKRIVPGTALTTLIAGTLLAGPVPLAHADPASGPLARFENQPVTWHTCVKAEDDAIGKALDAAGGRCAELTVPLDYTRPGGRTITLAVSRLPATDTGKRRGALFLNPGGPGGSGLEIPLLIEARAPDVRGRFDLIGVDPRFVGRSTPIDCGWPASTMITSFRGAGPDRASFDRGAAFAKDLAARCAASDAAAVLPYASTRNTARDLDVVRAALGEPKLSYLGYSYGTYLGAVYAQLFPGHVDRIVLDSALDPDVYNGGRIFRFSGPVAAAARVKWAEWTAARDGTYHLGTTSAQVLAVTDELRRSIEREPLDIDGVRLDIGLLPLLLWVPDDSDERYDETAQLVIEVRDALRGQPPATAPAVSARLASLEPDPASAGLSAQMAILCADRAAPRSPEVYYRDVEARRRFDPLLEPLFQNLNPCAFWPTQPVEAPTLVRNAVPTLILNSTGDNQTPYPGALALHSHLPRSRMVTLTGAYRHGVYLVGRSTCADQAVDRYLLDGQLPSQDVTCTTDRTESPLTERTTRTATPRPWKPGFPL